MKKTYVKPTTHVAEIQQQGNLLVGTTTGNGIHSDNPQDPGSAMGRGLDDLWDEGF